MEENAELVKWSPTFSVGVKVIDDQHKELLNLVNNMFNHKVLDKAAEQVYCTTVVQEAVQYVKVHFSTEEKLMVHAKYPGYPEHKKEHEAFIKAIVEYAKEFETGKRQTLLEFTRYLKEWILTHIAIMDKNVFISPAFKQLVSQKTE